MKVKIFGLSEKAFNEVTQDLTTRWAKVFYTDTDGVNIELNKCVTMSNGYYQIWLDLAGRKSTINEEDFHRIEIF